MGTLLRRITEDDLPALFCARNHPAIMNMCRQYAPLHWDDHLDWFEWQRKDPKTEMFIAPNDSGVVGLTSIDLIARKAEFSCYIDPSMQENGYGKLALNELFNFGFNDLNLNLIWGETFEGNPAYKIFTDKLGMNHDGTRREFYYKDGKYINAHLVSITRKEWIPK